MKNQGLADSDGSKSGSEKCAERISASQTQHRADSRAQTQRIGL
jgi:hypothetical protein